MSSFYAQYPSSSGGSNPSIGSNGVLAPTSSTEVGGIGVDGNLHPLSVTNTGVLNVNVTSTTTTPLPVTDAAAETSLASIDTKTPTVGQKAMAASSPVVIASDQSAVPVSAASLPLPAGASTSVLQTSGNTSLSSIDTKTPALGQALAAASVPVVLTAAQVSTLTPLSSVTVTQATGTNLHAVIDSGTISLPSGASTSALQSSTQGTVAAGTAATASTLTGGVFNTSLPTLTTGQQAAIQMDNSGRQITVNPGIPTALGQAAAASSTSVTLSNENVQDLFFTGQAAQTSAVNNIIPASAGAAATDATGYRSGTVQLICPAGTYTTGAVIFEGSNDNVNFQTIPVWSQLILTGTPIVAAITLVTTTSLIYTFPIPTRYIRVRISTGITGASAQVQAFTKLSQASWAPGIQQIAQATAANLNATVTATNLSTNNAQINGVVPLMGNGVTGTGSLRVTLASDTSSNTNAFLVSEEKAATGTLTNVASSATTVTLLASNAARKQATFFNDSTQTLYLKFGATASLTSYTVQIPANGYYELPGVRVYTGIIDGIWASANGNLRVTELT